MFFSSFFFELQKKLIVVSSANIILMSRMLMILKMFHWDSGHLCSHYIYYLFKYVSYLVYHQWCFCKKSGSSLNSIWLFCFILIFFIRFGINWSYLLQALRSCMSRSSLRSESSRESYCQYLCERSSLTSVWIFKSFTQKKQIK